MREAISEGGVLPTIEAGEAALLYAEQPGLAAQQDKHKLEGCRKVEDVRGDEVSVGVGEVAHLWHLLAHGLLVRGDGDK